MILHSIQQTAHGCAINMRKPMNVISCSAGLRCEWKCGCCCCYCCFISLCSLPFVRPPPPPPESQTHPLLIRAHFLHVDDCSSFRMPLFSSSMFDRFCSVHIYMCDLFERNSGFYVPSRCDQRRTCFNTISVHFPNRILQLGLGYIESETAI